MTFEIGNLKIEFRKPTAFEAVGFVPLFSRYLSVVEEANKAYREQMKSAKTEEEKKKVKESFALNRERLLASYFRSFDNFTRKELVKYIASLIVEWNRDKPPSPELIENLPPLILLTLFDNVAVMTLFGDEEAVNFFVNTSSLQKEKETKE
ncbi:MAG: hypothetical protein ACTSR2_00015 [Candidatus Hodarchaeales archaeon]